MRVKDASASLSFDMLDDFCLIVNIELAKYWWRVLLGGWLFVVSNSKYLFGRDIL